MKQAGYIVAALAVIGLIAFWVWRQQRDMVAALPPRIACADQIDAQQRAGAGWVGVLGTGSMAPFIPAAKEGQDPLKTVVAYVKPSDKTYDEIRRGDLVIYWADWARGWVCHQAAQQDGDGWIMSGLNNPTSESFARVTIRNFRAVVLNVYVWPFRRFAEATWTRRPSLRSRHSKSLRKPQPSFAAPVKNMKSSNERSARLRRWLNRQTGDDLLATAALVLIGTGAALVILSLALK